MNRYKAKNVDTDKALEYLKDTSKYQFEMENLETEKVHKYYEGIRKGLSMAMGIFECSNFEKKEEPTYEDGVLDFACELGKELDIPTQDLRDKFSSVDGMCAVLAERIKNSNNVSKQ